MMKSGKELDAEIARKVLHYIVIVDASTGEHYTVHASNGTKRPIEKFSTVVDEAYKVINYLSGKGYLCNVRNQVNEQGVLEWFAGFFAPNETIKLFKGKSLPHAVCIAALDLAERKNL